MASARWAARVATTAIQPPTDPSLPALGTALDGDAMATLLQSHLPDCAGGSAAVESCRPRYIRHKPGSSCLVQYELRLRDRATGASVDTLAHARLYADGRAGSAQASRSLARLVERAARRHPGPLGGRAAYIPALGAVAHLYPVDPDLPALVYAAAPRTLRHAVADAIGWKPRDCAVELVRYKPGRKALLRCDLWGAASATVYAKLHADARGATLLRAGRQLRQAGLATPLPLAYLADWRLLLHAEAQGRPLAGLGGAEFARWLGPVAKVLARLHAADAPALDWSRPAAEAGAALASGQAIAALLPGNARWATQLAAEVAALLAELDPIAAPIHGDFYDDQVLVGGAGMALIDFDEARLGHPLRDVGNFAGHLSARGELDARAAFLDAYGGDQATAAIFEAAALLKLAVGPFRRLEPDWPAGVERLALLARERLDASRARRQTVAGVPLADPALPQLPLLQNRGLVAGELARMLRVGRVEVRTATVVRHKPGRRCVLRYDLAFSEEEGRRCERFYAKTFASERGPLVHAIMQSIAAARACGPDVNVPAPVGYVPALKLLVQREVPGEPIAPRLAAGDERLAARVADALHAFHRSGLDLPRRHDLARELEPLRERVARLARECPALAVPGGRCLDLALAGHACDARWRWRPVHRDFYHDQLVDGDAGLGVLDFDDAALSEPAVDIANFLAHVRLLALQEAGHPAALSGVASAFEARARALDPDLDHRLLRRLEGATLLRLACIHVSREQGQWLAAQLLEAGEDLLRSAR